MARDWNVLVVEDDPQTAELLKLQLSEFKHVARVARNGQEAILTTGSRAPELIIMDLMMPELDGFETSRYIKHKFSDLCVPILVLTAIPDTKSRQECGHVGCDDLIGKPYDLDSLMNACTELIELGKAENQLSEASTSLKKAKRKERPAIRDQIEELMSAVCDRRALVIDRLIERGFVELIGTHATRIRALQPDHPALARAKKAAEGSAP